MSSISFPGLVLSLGLVKVAWFTLSLFAASFIDKMICIFLDIKMPTQSWHKNFKLFNAYGKLWVVNMSKLDIIIVPTSEKLDYFVRFQYG